MKLLKKADNPVALQALCDALSDQGIGFRVDGAGMSSLMPLTGLFDARIMVEEQDEAAALAVLRDLGMNDD